MQRARQGAAQAKLASAGVGGQPVGAAAAARLSTDSSSNNWVHISGCIFIFKTVFNELLAHRKDFFDYVVDLYLKNFPNLLGTNTIGDSFIIGFSFVYLTWQLRSIVVGIHARGDIQEWYALNLQLVASHQEVQALLPAFHSFDSDRWCLEKKPYF